jgi:hypothetical protein
MTKREKIFYEKWNWTERSVENCPQPDTCLCISWREQIVCPVDYKRYNDPEDIYQEIIMMHMDMVEQEARHAGVIL